MAADQLKPARSASQLEISQLATLACLLEVTAPKPGNVHRGADFDDLTLTDFLVSSVAVGPILAEAEARGVGETVLRAVRQTKSVSQTNTNLGTLLLLAPLAAVAPKTPLGKGIRHVLDSMSPSDSAKVYAAIRLAQPGGLGQAAEMDIAEDPPQDLRAAMRSAADRDLVAQQYASDFAEVFQGLDWLLAAREQTGGLTDAIVHAHLRFMAEFPDSLIARKCGQAVALESAARAKAALQAGLPGTPGYLRAVADLDFWLRSDHHRRNPGTTADLIAAVLFVGLRERHLQPPFK